MRKICFYFCFLIFAGFSYAEAPIANLNTPLPGQTIIAGDVLDIIGTVTGNDFLEFELSFTTGNSYVWTKTGITLKISEKNTTINSSIATWNTTNLDLSNWILRLSAYNKNAERTNYFVANYIDSNPPIINSAIIKNDTTSNNNWLKYNDNIVISINISDDYAIPTENIYADLSEFGYGKYVKPSEWITDTSGFAVWSFKAMPTKNGVISANIFVNDYGNNIITINLSITTDIKLPEQNVYINDRKVYSGDFFENDMTVKTETSDNYGIIKHSLAVYQNNNLLHYLENTDGSSLNLNLSDIDSLKGFKIVLFSEDIAGNQTTKNLSDLSATNKFIIDQAYPAPNPFNPNIEASHIGFKLSNPELTDVKLKIYTITGKLVYEDSLSSSNLDYYSEFLWDGKIKYGQIAPNGVYFAVLTAKQGSKEEKRTVKIAVLK